jgi:hypothetical protein
LFYKYDLVKSGEAEVNDAISRIMLDQTVAEIVGGRKPL